MRKKKWTLAFLHPTKKVIQHHEEKSVVKEVGDIERQTRPTTSRDTLRKPLHPVGYLSKKGRFTFFVGLRHGPNAAV